MISLPDYQVLTPTYESVNSELYRALRTTDGQKVILKVLKQDYPTPAELTRYRQEYELTRALNLDSVVKAYSLEKYHNTLVIILEDFGGISLKVFKENHPLNLSEFLSIAIQISTSLGQIHAANIIHKDINPANVVLNPETQKLKIIDFGISTRLTRENPTLKNPNVLEGTLAYISPEQTGRMNRSLDYRTDFYSLGVTFYELLTHTFPFSTEDDLELIHCHIAKEPPLPSEINPLIPPILSGIVMKLMAKNAEDRYQSAWGLKADLETCFNQLKLAGTLSYFPLATQDISDKFQIPQKLYGREGEIQALITAFERVKKQSEFMLIAGYSGIGKSALVQEIYKPITQKRGYFIAGKFDQFQRNIPYSALVTAFQGFIQQLLTENDAQIQLWKTKLLTALGINGQVISDVIPEIELIIGQQPPIPELGPTESQNRFNLVFQQFIRACCAKDHPLVIFLDDLQWADSATLKLIELMITDVNLQNLFLIGAYRDNEVSISHPLSMMLDELSKTEAIINQITLTPLGIRDIRRLMADTLKSDIQTIQPLAELILNKTGGNPFFVNQFLKNLYTENLINFDYNQESWQWNLAEIEAQNITDNVVELMIGKFKKLPLETQILLQLAACIGANFGLNSLSMICEKSSAEIFPDLMIAVESGLILSLSQLDEELLIQDYQFLHDRVQQAAYVTIPDSDKQKTHLKIGRLLLNNITDDLLEEHVFDIVNQFNQAISIIDSLPEKIRLAELNLMAGRKAKESIAYEPAIEYLTVGLELLPTDSWETHYPLTLSLYEATAEAAYLNRNFEQMEKITGIVGQKAQTILDKVKVFEVKMLAYITQTKLLEAVKIGLEALALLGISLPQSPTFAEIEQVFVETKALLVDKSEVDLLNLPFLTDPNYLAAIRILSVLFGPVFLSTPTLLPFLPCQQIALSLRYGNHSHAALTYANYAIIVNGFLQDIDEAYRFGQLALKFLSNINTPEIKGRTLNQIATFTMHGKAHIRETFSLFAEAYQSCVENGDLEFVGYIAMNKCQFSYFSGQELTLVEKEMANYCHALEKLNLKTSLNYNQIFWQATLNLRQPVENPGSLLGSACNEQELLPMLLSANDRFGLFSLYLHKLILGYWFEDYGSALEHAKQAEQYLDGATGFVSIPIFYWYDSLVRLALYSLQNQDDQTVLMTKVIQNQQKFQLWVENAPMNFEHKFNLVQAEIHRVKGEYLEAIECYEQAIQLAKKYDYLNEEGLFYELAAKFYLNWGKEKFAQAYMQEAYYAYSRWGAISKIKYLEQKYPELLLISFITPRIKGTTITRTATGHDSGTSLDFATVMKASQAISGEIILDKLLVALMKIMIQNAGAQLGYLVLETKGQLLIEASGVVDDDEVKTLQSVPLENNLPITIVNYVARSEKNVVLNDATREGDFMNDPYIQLHQPKSILCVPLLNQGQFKGIVYLENNLTTAAFTTERLEVIKLLSGQVVIALENARLYQTLENKVEERTAQLGQANQEIRKLNQKLKAENLRLSAEIDVAKKLQEIVLPTTAELAAIQDLDIAAYMQPADEVGGDYYDILSSQNGVKIAIGDVTGHGLESGVLMLMAQTAVRTLQKVNETDPVRFLDLVNQTLYDNLQRMNSDKNMSLAILDYLDGVVKLSGQHEEILVIRGDGTVEKIDTINLGFPMGLDGKISDFIAQQTVHLKSQDIVVLYTDGITEAENLSKQQYGLEKLCQVVVENRQQIAEEICQKVIDDVRSFIGEQKVFDDITLVILKQK